MQYLSQAFTRREVDGYFPYPELKKVGQFAEAVSDISFAPKQLKAEVVDDARTYVVLVNFKFDKQGYLSFTPKCSCKIGGKCAHAAAAMIHSLSKHKGSEVSRETLRWMYAFSEAEETTAQVAKPKTINRVDRLVYCISNISAHNHTAVVNTYKTKFDSEGRWSNEMELYEISEKVFAKPAKFIQDDDLALLRILYKTEHVSGGFVLDSSNCHEFFSMLQNTGRIFYKTSAPDPFCGCVAGEPRPARLAWGAADAKGSLIMRVVTEKPAFVFHHPQAIWYLDDQTGEIGQLQFDLPIPRVLQLLAIPALNKRDAKQVGEILTAKIPTIEKPSLAKIRTIEDKPIPSLRLATMNNVWLSGFRGYGYGRCDFDYATLSYLYQDAVVHLGQEGEFVTMPNGESVKVIRDLQLEAQQLAELGKNGFEDVPEYVYQLRGPRLHIFGLSRPEAWSEFMRDIVPKLREQGWQISMHRNFRHLILEVEAWEADFEEDADGWFNLNMGIIVNGQRYSLAPLLHQLFQQDPRWLSQDDISRIKDQEQIVLDVPKEGRVKVPAERIKPLARTLIELFDGDGESIRISRFDIARINELADMARWQFKGFDAIAELAKRLKDSQGVTAVKPPKDFGVELRPYQLEGLAWLQYLREQNISGILADDMGLGKTAQTLAHLLLEKQGKRMKQPSLVVLPTSLIFNWKREAQRFAPQLKLLSLHGKDRAESFDKIADSDIVLTTYPLLWRDEEILAAHNYHYLILDEAQTVKNVNSQAAQTVRKIKANHRLCLTGTPMENHLGELWAQFDFLLPGFLGGHKEFTSTWRTPIEKQGNTLRRDLLAKRVKPFILRRRKEEVAKELPPKTVIVRTVELEGKQRDLYETVRVAMNDKVREEIANKGFARSHIIILDALLKLRQVCCDPRLVKLSAASKVKERAKLDLLMEMLPELVDEGRRILVFSQFTSMLELIEQELSKAKIPFVKLTGDTQNREEVVRRFQDSEVPIFLISLKAGGVGLNLNMADTVIHYDPWWNPAVENQATDRAHRLGQTKNVFVYKLVVSGSIEEKILALQEKKAELAEGILSEDANGLVKFGESDIAALLEPLPL